MWPRGRAEYEPRSVGLQSPSPSHTAWWPIAHFSSELDKVGIQDRGSRWGPIHPGDFNSLWHHITFTTTLYSLWKSGIVLPCMTDGETEARNEEVGGPGTDRNRTIASGPDIAGLSLTSVIY